MHQELLVPIGATDRRFDPGGCARVQCTQRFVDGPSDPLVHLGIRHDPTSFADLVSSGLELGFDQHHHVAISGEDRSQRRQDHRQGDERQVGDDDVDHATDVRRGHGAHVVPLDHCHASVGSDPFVELPVSDVEGYDVASTSLEQAIGEPTGRGPGIEGTPTDDIDVECRESRLQLFATSADESRRLTDDLHRLTRPDEPRRLVGDGAANGHAIGGDQFSGLPTARGQASPDQFDVEPPADADHVQPAATALAARDDRAFVGAAPEVVAVRAERFAGAAATAAAVTFGEAADLAVFDDAATAPVTFGWAFALVERFAGAATTAAAVTFGEAADLAVFDDAAAAGAAGAVADFAAFVAPERLAVARDAGAMAGDGRAATFAPGVDERVDRADDDLAGAFGGLATTGTATALEAGVVEADVAPEC